MPTTLANVRLSVEPFMRYADSVRFRLTLSNTFSDGGFSIEARDSVGFITAEKRTVPIFGFTVGLAGQVLQNTFIAVSSANPDAGDVPLVLRIMDRQLSYFHLTRFVQEGAVGLQIVGTALLSSYYVQTLRCG